MSRPIKIVFLFVLLFAASGFFVYSQDETSSQIESNISEIPVTVFIPALNDQFKSGTDLPVSYYYEQISDCIAILMEHGDSSSYPALFSILTTGYPEIIVQEAAGALDVIPGGLHLFLLGIIENNPPAEKFIAFRTGINSRKLTVAERGQLAELALELSFAYAEDNADLNAMRYEAVIALTELKWKRANSLAIRHYYRTQADFSQGIISKDRYIEAIACLGAVGDSDAALILVLQLGLINARMERTGAYDPNITMAIVQALGNIGDNAAFDNLLFASNLPYGENIIPAAEKAIARLKW